MCEYLEATISQVASCCMGQSQPLQRSLRIMEETYGGTFTQVDTPPDNWKELAANFVVRSNSVGYGVVVYLNHPKTIAALREKGYSA